MRWNKYEVSLTSYIIIIIIIIYYYYYFYFIFLPQVVENPRVKNYKLKANITGG